MVIITFSLNGLDQNEKNSQLWDIKIFIMSNSCSIQKQANQNNRNGHRIRNIANHQQLFKGQPDPPLSSSLTVLQNQSNQGIQSLMHYVCKVQTQINEIVAKLKKKLSLILGKAQQIAIDQYEYLKNQINFATQQSNQQIYQKSNVNKLQRQSKPARILLENKYQKYVQVKHPFNRINQMNKRHTRIINQLSQKMQDLVNKARNQIQNCNNSIEQSEGFSNQQGTEIQIKIQDYILFKNRKLQNIQGLRNIRILKIRWVINISFDSLYSLLRQTYNLQELQLSGCHNLSAKCLQKIAQTSPNIKLIVITPQQTKVFQHAKRFLVYRQICRAPSLTIHHCLRHYLKLQGLMNLHIPDCENLNIAKIFQIKASILKSLTLGQFSGMPEPIHIRAIKPLTAMKNLENLTLIYVQIQPEVLGSILENNLKLKSLSLYYCQSVEDQSINKLFDGKHAQFKHFLIEACPINKLNIQKLRKDSIETLFINKCNHIDPQNVIQVINSQAGSIRTLGLCQNRWINQKFLQQSCLENISQLQSLYLSHCFLGKFTLKLKSFSNLETLYLSNVVIDDIESLSKALQSYSSLKHLSIASLEILRPLHPLKKHDQITKEQFIEKIIPHCFDLISLDVRNLEEIDNECIKYQFFPKLRTLKATNTMFKRQKQKPSGFQKIKDYQNEEIYQGESQQQFQYFYFDQKLQYSEDISLKIRYIKQKWMHRLNVIYDQQ